MHLLAGAIAASLIAAPVASAAGTEVIGGGEATEPYEFMAATSLDGEFRCGGSLIAPDWVVSAAHCFAQKAPDGSIVPIPTDGLAARVGSHDRTAGGSEARISEIVLHPGFSVQGGDIALLRLDHPVPQRPIGIADASGPAGTATRVLGWGRTNEESGELPVRLRELDTRIVPDDRCGTLSDPHRNICTEGVVPGTNACDGDSGGPQLQGRPGEWELIGATGGPADGDGKCGTGYGRWSDLPQARDWITATTG
ncbi:serine protease [Saccharopolyspora taberi]|uniref:Serine protease n=1 Tax=Saccharopolyspora taberi TaxID=60895 RepID=A0ABN3VJQ7_9PSEU